MYICLIGKTCWLRKSRMLRENWHPMSKWRYPPYREAPLDYRYNIKEKCPRLGHASIVPCRWITMETGAWTEYWLDYVQCWKKFVDTHPASRLCRHSNHVWLLLECVRTRLSLCVDTWSMLLDSHPCSQIFDMFSHFRPGDCVSCRSLLSVKNLRVDGQSLVRTSIKWQSVHMVRSVMRYPTTCMRSASKPSQDRLGPWPPQGLPQLLVWRRREEDRTEEEHKKVSHIETGVLLC